MESIMAGSTAPPLQLLWRSGSKWSIALPGTDTLYGITADGRVAAIGAATGNSKWQTSNTYISNRLAVQGQRLFAYRTNQGLCFIDDAGTSATERLVVSFGASPDVKMSTPVVDDRMLYYAVNQGLYAYHQDQGLQFGMALSEVTPHTVVLIGPRDIIVIDGGSLPTRYRVGNSGFQLVWTGEAHGVHAGQVEARFAIVGNRLVVAAGRDLVGYDLTTGRIAWHLSDKPCRAFATAGGVVYGAFFGATVRAISPTDGSILWQSQYLYDFSDQTDYGIAVLGNSAYFGVLMGANPDGAFLCAVSTTDGTLNWVSRSATNAWAAGIPVTNGTQLFCYGGAQTGAYGALPGSPRVTPDRIQASPRPLRGEPSDFGDGSVTVNLPVSARVSVAAYRAHAGLGSLIVNNANWGAGSHDASWDPGGSGGFTADNQFGFLLTDIQESGGPVYTQVLLVPVNTFPDILTHWARTNIEIMTYHRYVSGYPDQTFQPDNLVTRAESSTIIAKTLNLNAPSSGFHTKFTDIATHWARNFIMALEERGIVGGVQEPDGSYTFRPDLNMTRAEEARIVGRAYAIPPAPSGFVSRFKDIAGHWAEADIKALEAAGYVNGFSEPDGSYTYRPEQNLTRAELCTMVVRILKLTR